MTSIDFFRVFIKIIFNTIQFYVNSINNLQSTLQFKYFGFN